MKKILTSAVITALIVSCSKKETQPTPNQTDSTKIIDSINAARTKINDSIQSKNHFKDFSGTHKFTHNSIKASGSVDFKKMGRDDYDVSGNIKSGKESVTIKGTAVVVSTKHMNFTGEITQSISANDNGKPYTRKGTKTFMSKDGGKTWRLQDMVNGSGFVDYIDIHF
jgi:PBP1b-binding outer membrane lipoprotein LpoB